MSTKLFHGHLIEGFSLPAFLHELKRFRQVLEPLARAKRCKAQVLLATRAYDANHLGFSPHDGTASFLTTAEMKLMDQLQDAETQRRHDVVVDMGFEVTLFPVRGKLLALTFSGQNDFVNVWESQSWRRDFAYWDNTDPPQDVSAKDWQLRQTLWEEALGDEYRSPAEMGYSFTVLRRDAGFFLAKDEELAPYAPDMETRVKMLLTQAVLLELEKLERPAPASRAELTALEQGELGALVREDLLAALKPTVAISDLR
jgi:hypothetical protein